jgi:hypothetical protein
MMHFQCASVVDQKPGMEPTKEPDCRANAEPGNSPNHRKEAGAAIRVQAFVCNHCAAACSNDQTTRASIQQKLNEEYMVVKSDTVPHPRAVMVHSEDTPITD